MPMLHTYVRTWGQYWWYCCSNVIYIKVSWNFDVARLTPCLVIIKLLSRSTGFQVIGRKGISSIASTHDDVELQNPSNVPEQPLHRLFLVSCAASVVYRQRIWIIMLAVIVTKCYWVSHAVFGKVFQKDASSLKKIGVNITVASLMRQPRRYRLHEYENRIEDYLAASWILNTAPLWSRKQNM